MTTIVTALAEQNPDAVLFLIMEGGLIQLVREHYETDLSDFIDNSPLREAFLNTVIAHPSKCNDENGWHPHPMMPEHSALTFDTEDGALDTASSAMRTVPFALREDGKVAYRKGQPMKWGIVLL